MTFAKKLLASSAIRFLLLVLFASVLFACRQEAAETAVSPSPIPPTAMPEPSVTPESAPFRVIAYVTPNIVADAIPYDKLTHINYAFLLPNPDGTFKPIVNGWKLKQIVADANKTNVEVLISVGGWGWEKEFEAMAANPTTRTAFVENLNAFVAEYDLDGADVDWEYPQVGQSADNYLALMQEIREAMPDKVLTTAVVSHGANGDGVPTASFAIFDFVNIMTYDGPDHGTMGQFQLGLDYWRERGLPSEKIVMGIPFYARPSGTPYQKLVEANPEAANNDAIEWQSTAQTYNGIPTVQTKTELARQEAGGVMFWTLDYDALGDLSLLNAINQAAR